MAKRTIPKKKLKPVPRMQQAKIDWRKTLSKQTKAALIDALMSIIKGNRGIERTLTQRFKIGLPQEALVQQTRQAIADATTFDFYEMNSNFDYDYAAYQTIKENLKTLVKTGDLASAMALSLELMKSGSEQVEMSDEGDMTDDVEDCLRVVIKAIKSSDLPAETIKTWAKKMQQASRVGFICDQELAALAMGKP